MSAFQSDAGLYYHLFHVKYLGRDPAKKNFMYNS
jgi:hypothetical protein